MTINYFDGLQIKTLRSFHSNQNEILSPLIQNDSLENVENNVFKSIEEQKQSVFLVTFTYRCNPKLSPHLKRFVWNLGFKCVLLKYHLLHSIIFKHHDIFKPFFEYTCTWEIWGDTIEKHEQQSFISISLKSNSSEIRSLPCWIDIVSRHRKELKTLSYM